MSERNMTERTVYWVKPWEDGRWAVAVEGSDRPTSVHATKMSAVAAGKSKAKSNGLGQLKVQKKDGTIQTEYTYGDDPRDRKG